ncbi:MAG: ATP-dependent DNA helicase RecG [Eubacterium sp.]|nr:ATP-dependent DNA helicase RecG [Eubacterium sp.]
MELHSEITQIKGIGEKTNKAFQSIGVYTVSDILLYFPRKYEKFELPMRLPDVIARIQSEETQDFAGNPAVYVKIQGKQIFQKNGRISVTIYKHQENGVTLECVWYRMPYVRSMLHSGEEFILHGKIEKKGAGWQMNQPEIYTLDKYDLKSGNYMPVYTLTKGLTQNLMQKTVRTCLETLSPSREFLPEEIRSRNQLSEYNYAIRQIHFPDSLEHIKLAMNRLSFDEFFFFILSMKISHKDLQAKKNGFFIKDTGTAKAVQEKLPYQLTGAQQAALSQILSDLRSEVVMQRLVQGDVGSGKTIVAFLTMLEVAANGYQSALMAPTEVLARQHYLNFLDMKDTYGLDWLKIIYLSGSMKAREKRSAYEKMQLYDNAMVIGTHALIQAQAEYSNLALVITDEQHRFGVNQREMFAGKGAFPHVLVMSATPIPRTLAIIMYGELDITVIDEVPAKRLPVKNCVIDESYRDKAYQFIEKEISLGHQCYIVCPLVDKSENMEVEDVTGYTEKLAQYFEGRAVAESLHGKMKPALKNDIMERFSRNEIQILVSTTVIEVGVNVPNATVMMVENAERFGLAQLHQLRGRVGRGEAQSYCILMNGSKQKEAKARLEILNKTNDGFRIAEEDLNLRGPGDFFGIRQSGDFQFKIADIYRDAAILKKASAEAALLLQEDAELTAPEHQPLKQKLEELPLEKSRIL